MVFSDSMLDIVHQHWGGHLYIFNVLGRENNGRGGSRICILMNIHLRRSWCSRQRQSCFLELLFCNQRFPENQVLKNCCLYLFLNLCVHEEDSQLLSISFHYKRLNMTKVEQTTFEAIFKASPESRYEYHWCALPFPLAMRTRLRRLARGFAPVQFVYKTRL